MSSGKRAIKWVDGAWNEFVRTLLFYDKRNGSTTYSDRIEAGVKKKLDQVSLFPELAELYRDGPARMIIVETFVVLYECIDDTIVVQAFRDARQETKD